MRKFAEQCYYKCFTDLFMEGMGEKCFTQGLHYKCIEVNSDYGSSYAVFIDDRGKPHHISERNWGMHFAHSELEKDLEGLMMVC